MRRPFKHATKQRSIADPIVVAAELADGTLGYGETLPRPYVTGETIETVLADIPALMRGMEAWHPRSFVAAIELIDALPDRVAPDRLSLAARAGLETALLDAYSRAFNKSIAEAVGWLGLAGLGAPGSVERLRYSGVLSAESPDKLRRSIRKMRIFGLRDFKLKVGLEHDDQLVEMALHALGSSIGRKTTLRLDANAAWDLETARQRLAAWTDLPIASVEQPLPAGQENAHKQLNDVSSLPIMADESLLSREQAERFATQRLVDAFNIRISKNGGFLHAVRLAGIARHHGLMYQLGCMVGETSILAAIGRRFLEYVPSVRFAEGSYSRYLLREDVTAKPVSFSCGGRIHPLPGPGWGVTVDEPRVRHLCERDVLELRL